MRRACARRRCSSAGRAPRPRASTLIEGSCFAASPAGTTNRADYEFMRDEILGQLKAALPVDGLLLGLHGAMVAHGYDDVEGDIIERARAIVGPKCVIGVELDPHCHLTMKRVSKADIIVLYKEFPHTDVVERAEDVLDLVLATLRGKIKPVMSVYDCRQIQSYPTTLQPMRGLVDRIMAMEGKDGILSVSIAHCFPYGDVAEIGTRVLVIADGDKKKADALATTLGEELVGLRGKTTPPYFDVGGRRRRGRRLQRPAGGDRRSGRQCRRRRAVGQYRHPAAPDRDARSRTPASARSGIRSPCASASMPGSARRSPCASAARSP